MRTFALPAARTALAGAAAVAAALAVGLPGAGAHSTPPAATESKVVAFHQAMDRLWQDHVTWTRMAIVAFAAGSPDLEPALARLLRNQADIGDAIKPYYGAAAGRQLTRLLRTHIKEAVPVLDAAKKGDEAALEKALAAWHVNAREIATFLSRANPAHWTRAEMTTMMRRHLKLTTDEAVARLQGKWRADVAAYDRVRSEILAMSDMLADGIVAQFPGRFA